MSQKTILIIVVGVIVAIAVPQYEAYSKRSSLEKLFPNTSTIGAVGVKVDIKDRQTGKLVKGGVLIEGIIRAPRNIKNEQIKPTAMASLRELKKEFPGVEWFHFFMVDDERMVDCLNWIAIVDFKEGDISISGGIPTDEDINNWNADRIDRGDLPLLRRPTDEDLQLAQNICIASSRQAEKVMAEGDLLRSQGKFKEAERVQDYGLGGKIIDQEVAKVLNISYKDMKQISSMVSSYYWTFSKLL